MFSFGVDKGEVVIRYLDQLSKQGRKTIATAMTDTGWSARAAVQTEMRKVFDRPTTYALNGLDVEKARSASLQTRILFRYAWDKGVPAEKFMAPEVFGGARRQKRSELLLKGKGLLGSDGYAVPGKAAKLDKHGNMSRGQLGKALSYLKAFSSDAGQNRNEKGRQRGARRAEHYFAIAKKSGGLAPGIYQRSGRSGKRGGMARNVKPIMHFLTTAPKYTPLLPMAEVVSATFVREFPDRLLAALERAAAKQA